MRAIYDKRNSNIKRVNFLYTILFVKLNKRTIRLELLEENY